MRRATRLLSAVVAAQLTAIGLFATPAQAGPGHGGGSVSVDQPLTDLFGTYGNTAGAWSGADSTYSVPLPDGRIAWLFSDTFLGTVNPDGSRPQDSPFINNSIIVQDGDDLTTVTGGTPDAPRSLVESPNPGAWYWVGDGTVESGRLKVLLLEFERTGPNPFDFAFRGSALATFSLPDLALESVVPRYADSPVSWASAIYEAGGWTYVYGVEDLSSQKFLHVARARTGQLGGDWEFWDGTAWSADPAMSARLLGGVGNETSVTKVGGRLVLTTMDTSEPFSSRLLAYRATSPTGPFTGQVELYRTPETGGNLITYNAHAHPEIKRGASLVVTYNVNSLNTADVYADVDNYRPRFIVVPRSLLP